MTDKRILIGDNHVDNCDFCGAQPHQYKHLFVAPSGATMCDGCHTIIRNAMNKNKGQEAKEA